MISRRNGRPGTRRRGTTLVESALVYSVLFLIVMGIMIGGHALFRYQQLAHAAREGSRWASVRGAVYAKETGNTAATADDIYNNAVKPQLVGMDLTNVTYSVTWNTDNGMYHNETYTDSTTTLTQIKTVTNTVSVTVTYNWNPGIPLMPNYTMSSTSVTNMSY